MRWFALVLVLLSTSAALAQEVQIEADTIEAQGLDQRGEAQTIVGEGNVRVRTDSLLLRAPRLEIQRPQHTALLDGGVIGNDGLMVVSADRLSLDLDTRTLTLVHGQMVVKSGVSAADVSKLIEGATPIAARTTGKNSLTLRAERIAELPDGVIRAHHVWFTTCECKDGSTPFLSISARDMDLVRGESASLTWPTFRIFDVPVLPLPYASVPLAQRKSGVLFPAFGTTGPTGLSLQLPVFFTLGDSADVTFTLGAFNGGNTSFKPPNAETFRQGVRGFGDETEFRWRTAVDAAGSLRVQHYYDFDSDPGSTAARGNRGSILLQHEGQYLGGHAGLDVQAVSDSTLLLDTQALLPQANLPYLRSRAAYSLSGGSLAFGLDSTVIQSLLSIDRSSGTPVLVGGQRTSAWNGPGVVTPLARAGLEDTRTLGRLVLDEGATVLYESALPGLPIAPGRTRRGLADVALGQTLPLYAGPKGALSLQAGERADGLLLPDGNVAQGRLGGFVGAEGRTRLARTFASGWVHDIVPSLQLRALGGFGSAPFRSGLFEPGAPEPQDEFDAALPRNGTVQAITRVTTSLSRAGRTPVSLAIEHHVTLTPIEAGQLVSVLTLAPFARPVVTTLTSAWNLARGSPTQQAIRVTSPVGLGQLSVGAQYLNAAIDDRITRGLDLLFTPHDVLNRVVPSSTQPLVQADGGVDFPVGDAFKFHVGAVFSSLLDLATDTLGAVTQQYNAAVAYDAGGCARFSLRLLWTPGTNVQPFFTFELGDVRGAASAVASSVGQNRPPATNR